MRPRAAWLLAALVLPTALAIGPLPCVPVVPTESCREAWVALHTEQRDDAAGAIAVSPNGATLYWAGLTREAGLDYDFLVVALDTAAQQVVWDARYDGPGDVDVPWALAVSPDGRRVFVTGYSDESPDSEFTDYATLAFDAATGAPLWTARYDNPAGGHDIPRAAAVTADGATLVVGGASATVAYDAATGALRWQVNDGEVAPLDMVLSPDGRTVYTTGYGGPDHASPDVGTAAYDAATGQRLWAETWGGAADYDRGERVVATWGGVFVTGYADGGDDAGDFVTIAYDAASGGLQWASVFDGPGLAEDPPTGLALSPDGARLFVAGPSDALQVLPFFDSLVPPGIGVAVLAYATATGNLLWEARYDGLMIASTPTALVAAPDGRHVAVAGATVGPSVGSEAPIDALAVLFDAASGAQAWAARYDRAFRTDLNQAAAFAPDGRTLYAAGGAEGLTAGFDAHVAAYAVA